MTAQQLPEPDFSVMAEVEGMTTIEKVRFMTFLTEWQDCLDSYAAYLAEAEEGLREYSRTSGQSGMHPVHAANRLRIVREKISRKGE